MEVIPLVFFGDLVGAQALHCIRWMCHGFDLVGVDCLHLVDKGEDVGKVLCVTLNVVLIDCDTRQVSGILYVGSLDCHPFSRI